MDSNTIEIIRSLQVLIIPVVALIITQMIKIAIETIRNRKVDITQPYRYGGMPSSHSAAVVAATVAVALVEGIYSSYFALTLLFSLLVIRDALGLRMELTKHGIAINKLISRLPNGQKNGFKKQSEKVGHTFLQVVVGMVLGGAIAVLIWWVINF